MAGYVSPVWIWRGAPESDCVVHRAEGVADADTAHEIGGAWPNSAIESLKFIVECTPMNAITSNKKKLLSGQRAELLGVLKARFEENMHRHERLEWARVMARLEANPEKLWSLHEMEKTGGEPDVVGHEEKTGACVFYDCSEETPKGRRNVSYDREGQQANIKGRPNAKDNAVDMAAAMGIELLTEDQYQALQKLGNVDAKSSSWLQTPPEMRKLGGALFGNYHYGRVFVYHNGAQSYYGARGFRGSLKI